MYCYNYFLVESRTSTPGDGEIVYCVVVEGTAKGTAFAIGDDLLLTAYHVCGGTGASISICTSLERDGNDYATTELKNVSIFEFDENEDWAILKLESQRKKFTKWGQVCPESELPDIRDTVGIRDFPVDMLTSGSMNELQVGSSGPTKVAGYESRISPPNSPSGSNHVQKKVKLVKRLSKTVKDAIKVDTGRTGGSCGAPYFECNGGKVVAFHERSINDAAFDDDSVSWHSHHSKCIGFVLCRLPQFWDWYTNMKPAK